MLHGFGGTARHWDRAGALLDRERYSPLALELGAADPLGLSGALELIGRLAPERFVLCGYSMGGRVALHAALAMPQRVTRLVLLSSTAGIEDAAARASRRADDEALAREIERGSIEDFVALWRTLPLFADDPEWVQEAVADDTRRLNPRLLAGTLRAYSAGVLEPLWGALPSLAMPAVVLAGERDLRYRAIGERLAQTLADATYHTVPGAGHRLALEAPDAVASAIGP
jgi:2-succinyl-6-hydroxy-2,4-cyclohexadiene-1-carboxylate synthase